MSTHKPKDRGPIPLARPSIDDGELAAAERVLRSGRLSNGPEGARFESLLASACGREQAVCVSSGTAALELAFRALELTPGERVLIASFGFPAAAHAALSMGAIPVPVDADPITWTPDLEDATRAWQPGTRFLVTIDALGAVCSASAWRRWAEERSVQWISDAACGFGGIDEEGRPAGAGGAMATLSFHPRKVITTGEGGALVCADGKRADLLRQLRNLGQLGGGQFGTVATNARLAEVSAALGCAQMARLPAMLSERRMLADGYRRRLAPMREAGRLSWQEVRGNAVHAYQTFAVQLAADIERQAVIAAFAEAGIESTVATYAFHRIPVLAERSEARALPVADALHDRGLALPLYLGMRSAELDRVCDALAEAIS